MLSILVYPGLLVLNIFGMTKDLWGSLFGLTLVSGRTSSVDDAGQCLIGFAISSYVGPLARILFPLTRMSSSTAPTLAWSGLLVVAFALIFAYPLRRTTPAQTSNPMIRTISYRTLM